ncbi:MAG: hypothetical protein SVY41_00060 [Candidatus Nanohaloarchaea archaeon]|nr:hypothetical protein [Candidatus Nanohaloarchaea archaeon]
MSLGEPRWKKEERSAGRGGPWRFKYKTHAVGGEIVERRLKATGVYGMDCTDVEVTDSYALVLSEEEIDERMPSLRGDMLPGYSLDRNI